MKNSKGSWRVCIGCILMMFVCMGMAANVFSTHFPYIREAFDLTNAQTSLLVTLRCIFALIAMLLSTYFYEKVSLRIGCTIAALLSSLAFVICSFSKNIVEFGISSVFLGLSYGLGTMVPVSLLINNWFTVNKSLAVGIASAGSGISTFMLPSLITILLEKTSMSLVFILEALFVAVITVVIFVLIKDKPNDKQDITVNEKKESLSDEPINKMTLITMVLIAFLVGGQGNPGHVHFSLHYTNEGYNAMFISLLLSLVGAALVVGKLIYGKLCDKIGGYKSTIIFWILEILGNFLVSIAFIKVNFVAVLAIISVGGGYAITTVGPTIWANEFSNNKKYSKLIKNLQTSAALGVLVFSSVPGQIADKFNGSYLPAYIMFSIMGVMGLILTCVFYKKCKK